MSSSGNITLDISARALQDMERNLGEKQLRRVMKNTLNKEARKLLKAAKAELSKVPVHNAAKIAKTLRGGANKRLNGLNVYAAYNGYRHPKGMYAASRKRKRTGQRWTELKPIAFWLGTGTKTRSTHRGGKNRGDLPSYDYMAKAEAREKPQIARRIIEAYEKAVEREAMKGFRKFK